MYQKFTLNYRRVSYMLVLLLPFIALFWVQSQSLSNEVWVVPIDSDISPATSQFVQSRIRQANEADPQPLALAFLIDTPGGRVDAMKDISNAIIQNAELPTVAFVQDAYSAGALIAMSAEQLVMLPNSNIGAALTVVLDPTSATGTSYAGEKANSVTRSQFRTVANLRGRNADVAEAMVALSLEIPDLVDDSELVTLGSSEAVEYGIADAEANTIAQGLEALGYSNVKIEYLEPAATERVALWLASPLIAAALLAIGILGILLEIFVPGFGIPGIVGTLALLLFFSSRFIASPTGVWDIALFLLAIILLAVELFVLPGFGIAGIAGLIVLAFATYRLFEGDVIAAFGYTSIFAAVAIFLVLWLFGSGRFVKPLLLSARVGEEENNPQESPPATPPSMQGQQGIAITDLRPAGTVAFGDKRLDVVAESAFIVKDSKVKVILTEGYRIVVREISSKNS